MDIFAACYMHSLHGQIFVERPAAAASWQLHTLSLAHVEAALAQHGLGLMPAAVNAAYLMLGRCFVKLSQVAPPQSFCFLTYVRIRYSEGRYMGFLKGLRER